MAKLVLTISAFLLVSAGLQLISVEAAAPNKPDDQSRGITLNALAELT